MWSSAHLGRTTLHVVTASIGCETEPRRGGEGTSAEIHGSTSHIVTACYSNSQISSIFHIDKPRETYRGERKDWSWLDCYFGLRFVERRIWKGSCFPQDPFEFSGHTQIISKDVCPPNTVMNSQQKLFEHFWRLSQQFATQLLVGCHQFGCGDGDQLVGAIQTMNTFTMK